MSRPGPHWRVRYSGPHVELQFLNPWRIEVLGVFGKVVRGQQVKSRLLSQLSRREACGFYVASLADTLETALCVTENPVLFLQGGEDPVAVDDLRARVESAGLESAKWSRLRILTQLGADLGARLERAFKAMHALRSRSAPEAGCLILGSDSPSVTPRMVRNGMELMAVGRPDGAPDVVLGPTVDGGYWCIGVREPTAGLLEGIAWSTERALADTVKRCRRRGLSVRLVDPWTDVDVPEDLHVLREQIRALRRHGDARTAQLSERALAHLAGFNAP